MSNQMQKDQMQRSKIDPLWTIVGILITFLIYRTVTKVIPGAYFQLTDILILDNNYSPPVYGLLLRPLIPFVSAFILTLIRPEIVTIKETTFSGAFSGLLLSWSVFTIPHVVIPYYLSHKLTHVYSIYVMFIIMFTLMGLLGGKFGHWFINIKKIEKKKGLSILV